MMPVTAFTINRKYILITPLAVLSSWLLHELAHYFTGELLGYDMAMTLNKSYPVNGSYNKNSHYHLISAAGPLVTLLEAFLVYFLMRRGRNYLLYPFLFTCFYIRLMAAIISFFNPNDEARISKALGIGTFTLPLLIVALLFYLVYQIAKDYAVTKKFNLITLVFIILFSSAIILSDQFLQLRIF